MCATAEASEGLRDVRGPVGLPEVWPWIMAMLAILLVGIAVILFFKKRSLQAKVPEVFVPSWERALKELGNLRSSRRTSPEEVKAFYSAVSAIVRHYIEERFDLRAPEMTTEEFLDNAACSKGLTDEHRETLQKFLSVSDMVKFARFVPRDEDMDEAIASAIGFVERTVPVEEEGERA